MRTLQVMRTLHTHTHYQVHRGVWIRGVGTRGRRGPGTGPVRLIISMIKWIRTSRFSIKNSLFAWQGRMLPSASAQAVEAHFVTDLVCPLAHSPTLSLYHRLSLTLSRSHSLSRSLSHSPTLPLSHSPTLSLYHSVHFVTDLVCPHLKPETLNP